MNAFLRRTSARVVALRHGEGRIALLMFAYSFLAMTAYNILKPVSRSKFITELGADNLPWVLLGAGLLLGVIMQLYAAAAQRIPRRWIIPVTLAGKVCLLVVFWLLFRTGAAWVSVAFYVFGLLLGILLISQFWTLANDLYDPRQAKRLFGFIGGGASLGGAMGAGLTAIAVDEVGTNNLLLVSAVLLAITIGVVTLIVRDQPEVGTDLAVAERGVGGAQAIRLLTRSRQLQIITMVIAFAAIGGSIIDQQLNMAVEGRAADDITSLLAQVGFYLSMVGFVVQVGLTSRVHRSLGLAIALLILPIGLGSTAVVILLTGAIWAPAAARVIDTSLRYTIDKTTREVLFLPVPADIKLLAKPFIDVTMDRVAKALGALLTLVLIKPWGLNLDWRQLSYVSLVIMALWVAAAMLARREYLRSFRHSISTRAVLPDAIRLDVADAATIEALVEELASPDETSVLYAIDLLETLQKRNLITPLLLHHESAKVRARALLAMQSPTSNDAAARWRPMVERMLSDESVDVRVAAVGTLSVLAGEEIDTIIRQHLQDPNPRVVITAASILADRAAPGDVEIAEATLRSLIADVRPASSAVRREVAAALGRIRQPRIRPLLVGLLADPDVTVAGEAIRSACRPEQRDLILVPALVSLLSHRALKRQARQALVSYGDQVVSALAYFLGDVNEQPWVRRHIPATLARLPSQASMDALWAVMTDADGFLRFKALTAIEALHRTHPRLTFGRVMVEQLVVQETTRYCNCVALRENLLRADRSATSTLVVRALEDRMARSIDRTYRLLGLIHPWKDVSAARFTIEQGTRRSRAMAVEYLDTLLGAALRRRVIPLIEEATPEQRFEHANLMIKSRPRSLDETLALLVHEDDQVVSAAAILYIGEREAWSMVGDLEFILARRQAADWYVFEAASWVLAFRRLGARQRTHWREPLPVIEMANRLRAIPLFAFLPADELCRIAGRSHQVGHDDGASLYQSGTPAMQVHFMLEGSVRELRGDLAASDVRAPAVLALEETLTGSMLQRSIEVAERTVCLALDGAEFIALASDNVMMTHGLFRMMLGPADAVLWNCAPARTGRTTAGPIHAVDKVILLSQHPLFAKTTAAQLVDLAAIARELRFVAGQTLFGSEDAPAIYHIVSGGLRLDAEGAEPVDAGAGHTVGVAAVLRGESWNWRATATADGHALCIDREELLEVLHDDVELLQTVIAAVLAAARSAEHGANRLTEGPGAHDRAAVAAVPGR